MFLECAELRPFIGKYTRYIFEGIREMRMSFKQCAILLDSASDNNELERLLRYLEDCEKHWLVYLCFFIACYQKTDCIKHTIRPNWRTNVAILGEMVDFNAETVLVVLSFIEPEEHVKITHFWDKILPIYPFLG